VRARYSQFNGSRPSKFAFRTSVSQFNGNRKLLIYQQTLSHAKEQHDTSGEAGTEFRTPEASAFVSYYDAALGEDQLDVTQAEAEQ